MKSAVLLRLIPAILLVYTPIGFTSDKPMKATTPLSEDDVAIYKAVLLHYGGGNGAALNVAKNTYPLDPSSPMNGLQEEGCLKGIQLDNLSVTAHSFHELQPDVLPDKKMQLVDPEKQGKLVRSNDPSTTIRKGKKVDNAVESAFATALFSMSEIAFDKEPRFAVVSYRFWCGSLCGNGSTLVFEKINGVWRNAKRNCGGWIS